MKNQTPAVPMRNASLRRLSAYLSLLPPTLPPSPEVTPELTTWPETPSLEAFPLFNSTPEPELESENVGESMPDRIRRVSLDFQDISAFYNIECSPLRQARLTRFYITELSLLHTTDFSAYDQDGKIEYLLLQNYLRSGIRQIGLEALKDKQSASLLPFAQTIINLCEARQQMKAVDGETCARDLTSVRASIAEVQTAITMQKVQPARNNAFRAANTLDKLRLHLKEWYEFYKGYDPMFTWWVSEPWSRVNLEAEKLAAIIRENVVGIKPGDEDAIVGEPIGRVGLLAELEAEMIPYSPEELLEIGNKEYAWCEVEMKKASAELGYGDKWRDALEHVKYLYMPPGRQPQLVRNLASEAVEYVKEHDLITVPEVAQETWRMFMMTPERQKINPFFLGGDDMIVSYPTDTMDHEDKLMSMRGNNIHFSRSTVQHEMIPGHHLQMYSIKRFKPYRQLFDTVFWIEGWAFYWELLLFHKGFQRTPENEIGMLFWRMHRCARILFSIKFHLGLLTPQQCIDLLVDMVGHERATAEGEVRRSFNGDYKPLYQAGYMIGALQMMALRRELVDEGKLTEKQFHDRVMRENEMPIEMLRALMTGQDVTKDFKSEWRFYQSLV